MTPACFSAEARAMLLAIKGVGPTVLDRLESLDITTLEALATQDAEDICRRIAAMLGASCWANSPMARSAIVRAIETARAQSRGSRD